MIAIPFALGEATNGLVAYLFPEWIHFQVAILHTITLTITFTIVILKFGVAVLCGLPLLAWFVIPESPRWLIERQRAHRC